MSYDGTWSLSEKVKFAKTSGMAGCFTWSLDQVGRFWGFISGYEWSNFILFLSAFQDDGTALQDVIRKNLGK